MYIIEAEIRGFRYWLKETGKGNPYQWVGVIQNATSLHEIEAKQFERHLKQSKVSWPIDIIPYN